MQKPNINKMIGFKKQAGRYQPFKDGKNLDLRNPNENKHTNNSVYGRHSNGTKDELYQEMREGTPDEEDEGLSPN